MTWQRIDENTYIDDTLVTCAEYQLFLDEMREQGKYYQPDHWTSYQFPEGQAREPILGVRHSDAVAFCEWLSTREFSEWNYRLSVQMEAERFLIKPKNQGQYGYWISNDVSFVWISQLLIENSQNNFHEQSTLPIGIENLRKEPGSLDDLIRKKIIHTLAKRDVAYASLSARIAGRSPAFEGIRLVKERIK